MILSHIRLVIKEAIEEEDSKNIWKSKLASA